MPRHTPRLTPRRRAVLRLLARGHSYREIARVLGVRPRTVRSLVAVVAEGLPNPDGLPAQRLVLVWSLTEGAPLLGEGGVALP